MISTYQCVKYRGVPAVCRCSWTLLVITFSILYVAVVVFNVNAKEVRGTYRQRHRTVELSEDPRIIGGTPVSPGTFPFYVNTIQPILCGGTLIAPDIVLTAAHCGGGFLAGVNIGGILLDGTDAVETLAVDSEFPHPDYDEATQVNDIMLVKLTDPSTFSPVVQMNFDEVIPEIGDVVTLAGFGDTADGGDPSNELLTVTVDTYADDICFNLYSSYVPETMICAGTVAGGRDSCQGDSGGPLLTADNVQIGVVSTGSGCGEADLPAIYTEVAAFESFIRQGICSLSDTPPTGCGPTVAPASFQPTVTLQPTTTMFPSIDSAQPIAGGVPSTAIPVPLDRPTTSPAPVIASPAIAPTPAVDAPTRAPLPAVNVVPTSEPTINAETDVPTNIGDPTVEPTKDDAKPPKQVGKGKGQGKGQGKGKGKGDKVHYGKGKGMMHMYSGKGRGKSMVQYSKGFKVTSQYLLSSTDDYFGTNDDEDYEYTSTDGENDDVYKQ